MSELRAREAWREQAACRGEDTSIWFNEHTAADALAICRRCPVQDECLAYINTPTGGDDWWRKEGVWGGLTAGERRPKRQRRKKSVDVELSAEGVL